MESCPVLDVNQLSAMGYLQPGWAGQRVVGSIGAGGVSSVNTYAEARQYGATVYIPAELRHHRRRAEFLLRLCLLEAFRIINPEIFGLRYRGMSYPAISLRRSNADPT